MAAYEQRHNTGRSIGFEEHMVDWTQQPLTSPFTSDSEDSEMVTGSSHTIPTESTLTFATDNRNNPFVEPIIGHPNTVPDISPKDDDFADWNIMDHTESARLRQSSEIAGSHKDSFGNAYDHVNFNARIYTNKRKFKGQKLVYFTSAFVSLFVSLFGYEQGVCSGILTFVTFQEYFRNPSATEIGLVISILEIGAMISSLLVSLISEKIGRKKTILLGTIVFIVGGTLQTFAANLWVFGTGRVFSGFGVGVLSTVVPSYQCEISPVEERGKLVCGEFTGNISGYFLSVWVDYFCYFIQDVSDARENPHSFAANLSWRLPLFIQVILGALLLVGGVFVVESPRWLLDVDDDERGFHVLCLLYHDDPDEEKAEKEFF